MTAPKWRELGAGPPVFWFTLVLPLSRTRVKTRGDVYLPMYCTVGLEVQRLACERRFPVLQPHLGC